MTQASLFTTHDGDIVLRAGAEPDSKHDFRVHKFILSLASSVFKDMFAFPQPSDQTLNERQLPVVDVSDPPAALDVVLRLIYPGVEPPKITERKTLSASLLTADKYNITSIYPTLRENLKTFLPGDREPLWAYIIACRFGFLEEKKQAAEQTNSEHFLHLGDREVLQLVSSTDLFQLVEFIQRREFEGRSKITWHLYPTNVTYKTSCEHKGRDTQYYYSQLEKEVWEAFFFNPCLGPNDLFAVVDRVHDPPPGCDPLPMSGDWYSEEGDEDDKAFKCPLQPMTIRRKLVDLADVLRRYNKELLQRYFGGV